MRISRVATYGILSVAHLSRLTDGQYAPSRALAQLCGTSSKEMLKILPELVAAGILRSTPSGFALNKAPDCISLLDVIEAISGKLRNDSSFTAAQEETRFTLSAIEQAGIDAAEAYRAKLSSVTVVGIVPPAC